MLLAHKPAILTTLYKHMRGVARQTLKGGQMEIPITLSTRGPPEKVRTRLPADKAYHIHERHCMTVASPRTRRGGNGGGSGWKEIFSPERLMRQGDCRDCWSLFVRLSGAGKRYKHQGPAGRHRTSSPARGSAGLAARPSPGRTSGAPFASPAVRARGRVVYQMSVSW